MGKYVLTVSVGETDGMECRDVWRVAEAGYILEGSAVVEWRCTLVNELESAPVLKVFAGMSVASGVIAVTSGNTGPVMMYEDEVPSALVVVCADSVMIQETFEGQRVPSSIILSTLGVKGVEDKRNDY